MRSKADEGVVRYIGEITGRDGIWIGVELDAPVGKNSGIVDGEKLFDCAPNCGLFTRSTRLTLASEVPYAFTRFRDRHRGIPIARRISSGRGISRRLLHMVGVLPPKTDRACACS